MPTMNQQLGGRGGGQRTAPPPPTPREQVDTKKLGQYTGVRFFCVRKGGDRPWDRAGTGRGKRRGTGRGQVVGDGVGHGGDRAWEKGVAGQAKGSEGGEGFASARNLMKRA